MKNLKTDIITQGLEGTTRPEMKVQINDDVGLQGRPFLRLSNYPRVDHKD